MSGSAPRNSSSMTPRAARAQAEDTFGERLRGWIARSGAAFSDVGRVIGVPRNRLYETLDGDRPFHAAWVELLPPAVLRLLLEELAAGIGERLVPVGELDLDGHDDHQQLAELIHEATDVIRVGANGQADGYLSVEDCDLELEEITDLEAVLARRRARLVQVRADRGAPLRMVPRRDTTGSER